LSASSPEDGAPWNEAALPAGALLGLTDTHCHLNSEAFAQDLEQVLASARRGGVVRMLVPGVDLASSLAAVELAGRVEEVFAAVGVHPHSAPELNSGALSRLRTLAQTGKVVAVGEIGLDFSRDFPGRGVQRESFQAQLDLAGDLDLPIVVHVRDSIEETLRTLEDWAQSRHLRTVRGVFHAYGGSQEIADFAGHWGLFLGIGGIITYPKADGLRERMRTAGADGRTPMERALLETDAPYLAPIPHRGRRNEPAFLRHVALALAGALEMTLQELETLTDANARRFFHRMVAGPP
jgi:TatD DNase family protein